jgi:putative SOS response-associated peptidase YedK
MPIILHARDYDRWLDPGETEQLHFDLLRPFDASEMEMHKANLKVNRAEPRNGTNIAPESARSVKD